MPRSAVFPASWWTDVITYVGGIFRPADNAGLDRPRSDSVASGGVAIGHPRGLPGGNRSADRTGPDGQLVSGHPARTRGSRGDGACLLLRSGHQASWGGQPTDRLAGEFHPVGPPGRALVVPVARVWRGGTLVRCRRWPRASAWATFRVNSPTPRGAAQTVAASPWLSTVMVVPCGPSCSNMR